MRLLLFVAVVLASSQAQDYKSVFIKQGPVKGYKVPNYGVFAFYGIPFATAPKGPEKFKAPLPPPVWTEPFEAVNKDIICPQGMRRGPYTEECLVASVYVPDTEVTDLPVMVLVHGGGFIQGTGNSDTPFQFIDNKKNVIVVTFNYRVGPVGFLCLGTPDAPGNAGLRDQVAALKWVQENIAAFGGNPNDVTLAGCSAGGASVDLLMISKAANGLFNKVICQSGANIAAFATQSDPIDNALNYARSINYNGPDTVEGLEAFYKDIPYEQLLSLVSNSNKDVAVIFSPCVERDLGFERIIDDAPINTLQKGDYFRYPVLYGWAEMEGIYRVYEFEEWKDAMNDDFTQFLPADLKFDSEEQKNDVANRVKKFYFGDGPVTNEGILDYVKYNTDVMFVVSMQRAVKIQVEAGNDAMYVSVFSFTDNDTNPIQYTDVRGATHCTQSRAVMDSDETNMTPEHKEIRAAMRELWLNFVVTGNPTPDENIPARVPKWHAAGVDRTPCMDLGNPIKILPGPFTEDRQRLWDEIYDRHYRYPVAPYDL